MPHLVLLVRFPRLFLDFRPVPQVLVPLTLRDYQVDLADLGGLVVRAALMVLDLLVDRPLPWYQIVR